MSQWLAGWAPCSDTHPNSHGHESSEAQELRLTTASSFLLPGADRLTVQRQVCYFLSGCHCLKFSVSLEYLTHTGRIFLWEALESLSPCLAHTVLTWHFYHNVSASFCRVGTSTQQFTSWVPCYKTGRVPAWADLKKDPTRMAKGKFQVSSRLKSVRKHVCCTCWAWARNPLSLQFCAVAKWEVINHFLTNPNSYLIVPSQSLFCYALIGVSQTLRLLSKYSSSQMAGTLTVTWQNLPKDNFVMHNHAWWHSAEQIHPDTSFAAPLNPASSNQNFLIPRIRHSTLQCDTGWWKKHVSTPLGSELQAEV